jgi:hypothetical protein
MKREPQGRNFGVINDLQPLFEKWVEHHKSTLLSKGVTLKKRLSLHLHKVLTWSNKVSPQTFQMVPVLVKCKYVLTHRGCDSEGDGIVECDGMHCKILSH